MADSIIMQLSNLRKMCVKIKCAVKCRHQNAIRLVFLTFKFAFSGLHRFIFHLYPDPKLELDCKRRRSVLVACSRAGLAGRDGSSMP